MPGLKNHSPRVEVPKIEDRYLRSEGSSRNGTKNWVSSYNNHTQDWNFKPNKFRNSAFFINLYQKEVHIKRIPKTGGFLKQNLQLGFAHTQSPSISCTSCHHGIITSTRLQRNFPLKALFHGRTIADAWMKINFH